MAYNNTFPVNYQPQQYYPQYQQPAQIPQMSYSNSPMQNNGLTWVQGEAAAKSYHVQPNSTVALWDSENQTVYLKSADASGMPSMKILDYNIRDYSRAAEPQVVATQEDYITRDELSDLESRLMKQIERIGTSKKGESK